MYPFAQLWAAFLAWYHSPTRILSKLDGVQNRLTASAQHHNAQATIKTALSKAIALDALDHTDAADRATRVSARFAELVK